MIRALAAAVLTAGIGVLGAGSAGAASFAGYFVEGDYEVTVEVTAGDVVFSVEDSGFGVFGDAVGNAEFSPPPSTSISGTGPTFTGEISAGGESDQFFGPFGFVFSDADAGQTVTIANTDSGPGDGVATVEIDYTFTITAVSGLFLEPDTFGLSIADIFGAVDVFEGLAGDEDLIATSDDIELIELFSEDGFGGGVDVMFTGSLGPFDIALTEFIEFDVFLSGGGLAVTAGAIPLPAPLALLLGGLGMLGLVRRRRQRA